MQNLTRLIFIALILPATCCSPSRQTGDHANAVKTTSMGQTDILARLTSADRALADHPSDLEMLIQRATCLAMLGRYSEAVEAYRHMSIRFPSTALDRTTLYLWTLSLFEIKTYGRAQLAFDILSATHPHSHVTDQGRELSLKIEKRLAKSASTKNLNWYLNQGVQAYRGARPALAIDYLEECMLLSKRGQLTLPDADLLHFSLGGAYLETGDTEQALLHLKKVDPGYAQHRSGLMLALAMKATESDDTAAREMLLQITRDATRGNMRVRAQQLLDEWKSEGMDTP